MAKRRPYNPLAPLAPKQLNAMARRYAQAQFGPVLSQINAEYAQRARAGSSAIASSTNQLAQALAPVAGQTHNIYAGAQSAQGAIDAGLANRLTAAGQSAQADVSGQLAAAGQAPSPTNLAQIGAGAGAASYGLGSAALSRLVAEGASRENYAAQLPGIARLGGAQRGQDLALQLESGRQKDVGDLRSKLPGTVAQIEQDLQNREFQKAVASQSGLLDQQKLGSDVAYKQARLGQYQQGLNIQGAKAKVDQYYKDANLQISQGRLNIAARHEAKYERSKAGKKGGYTPLQLGTMRSNALEATKAHKHGQPNPAYDPTSDNYHNGVPDKQRTISKPVSAQEAFRSLVNHGVPPSLADDVVGRVYGKWKVPGQRSKRGPGGAGPR